MCFVSPIGITATLLLHHHQCLDSMGGFCLGRYQHLYPWVILLQDGVQSPKRLCTIAICSCNKLLLNSKYPSLMIEILCCAHTLCFCRGVRIQSCMPSVSGSFSGISILPDTEHDDVYILASNPSSSSVCVTCDCCLRKR